MELDEGAEVFTADGKAVGRVDRVVMDPRTKKVTHVVVRQGTLFVEDKVMPLDWVASGTRTRLTLREGVGDPEALPTFQETHYVELDQDEKLRTGERAAYTIPPLYWYPSYGAPALAGPIYPPGLPGFVARTEENIPEGSVALKEGARVTSVDGRHVGDVERVLTDPESDRITHFVISSGLLLKARKLVPTTWVDEVREDEVRLAVGSRILDELKEYRD